MAQRNTHFTGHMIDIERDQQGQSYPPESCIIYRSVPNFPQPNIHPVLPTPGNHCNFNLHQHPGDTLFYGRPQYDGLQPQHPASHLDLVVATPSSHYVQYLVPPSGIRDYPVHVNHGAHDQLSHLNSHRVIGVPKFVAHNGEMGTFLWPNLAYVHASTSGVRAEAMNLGMQGYQGTASSRSISGLQHPSVPQSHPNPHQPHRPMQRHFIDAGPSFLAPAPPMGFHLYWPQHSGIILEPNARHQTLPLRVLPEDEVAILHLPSNRETGNSMDHHRDMRLDIDHMSYEELLALEEQIGSVGTGLVEEFILSNLKTRTFTSVAACLDLEEASCLNKQINLCVICQSDYEDGECIGTLDCGHEFHRDCVKKWLAMKNTCPVCKSKALSSNGKDS